jgi:HSP20 family protein
MAKYKRDSREGQRAGLGELNGLFSGLGNILKAAADLADKTDVAELSRAGSIGSSNGMRGMYGVSVRVAPATRPVFRKPASLRHETGASARDELREPPIDLFDEGDHYLIVAEFSGVEGAGVRWNVNGQAVTIEAMSEDRHFYKELELPSAVDPQTGTAACKNGILELKLWKK